MSVQQPHDRFFRQSFGRSDIACNFLEEYLPAEIQQVLNLDSLVLQDGSFVDEEMQTHQSDLIYQVGLSDGTEAYLYFLFEHKSYPDPQVALQLLRYMVRLWERQQQQENILTPIIPLVVYHGRQRWHIASDFLSQLNAPPELTPYLPNFQYVLRDFSHLSDESIRGEIWLQVALGVMKAVFDPRLRAQLDDLLGLAMMLNGKTTGVEYIRTVLYYLSTAAEHISRNELIDALKRYGQQGERFMGTIAQEIRQEVYEEVFEEAKKDASFKIAKQLLKFHDLTTISEITGLSIEEVQALIDEQDEEMQDGDD